MAIEGNNFKGVRYIEPNLIHSIKGTDGLTYETVPNMEDYCVVVNIGVTVNGRRYAAEKTVDGYTFNMTWNGATNTVNFMQGTKIKYNSDEENGESINSLTTNYADMSPREYLNSKGKKNTTEMFGIESIDINYDNYYVPQVTIKFIDIRGMSLFMPEELRHGKSMNGLDGLASDDIAGSFFKSFFSFPYPKFDLMVKGLYGKPVVYELTVVDWKANFDCSRGSFGCTVNFIGYSYAMLSDLTLNAIVAASESDYCGKEYFHTNNNFKYHEGTQIKTFNEFWNAYKEAKVSVDKVMASSNIAKEIQELTIEKNNLLLVLSSYETFISRIQTFAENNNKSGIKAEVLINEDSREKNAYIFFNDIETPIPTIISKAKDNLLSAMKSVTSIDLNNGCFKYWYENPYPTTFNLTEAKYKNPRYIQSQGFHFFVAFTPNGLKSLINSRLDANTKRVEEIQEELGKQKTNLIAQHLGFSPDMDNLIRMFCAHIDTLLHCIYTAASKASTDNGRKLNSRTKDYKGDVVPPFPLVTRDITLKDPDYEVGDGKKQFTKYEDAWIGEAMDESQEANLVEGLLNGIKLVYETIDNVKDTVLQSEDKTRNDKLYLPIVPYDFINDDSVFFEKGEEVRNNNETFCRILFRGYTISALSSINKPIDLIGRIDALNFYNMTGNSVSKDFKKQVKNKPTEDYISKVKVGSEPLFISFKNSEQLTLNPKIESFFIDKNEKSQFFPIADIKFSSLGNISSYDNSLIYNHESDKQAKYALKVLNQEEMNIFLNKINNPKSTNNTNDNEAYKNIFNDVKYDEEKIINDYYDNNIDSIIENVHRSTSEIKSCVFGNYRYYYTDNGGTRDVTSRSMLFLESLVSQTKAKDFITWLMDGAKGFVSVPHIILVYLGALIEEAKGNVNNAKYFNENLNKDLILRKEIVDTLVREYRVWLEDQDSGFGYIQNKLELQSEYLERMMSNEKDKLTNSNWDTELRAIPNNPYSVVSGDTTSVVGKNFVLNIYISDSTDESNNYIKDRIRNLMVDRKIVIKSINQPIIDTSNRVLTSISRGSLESYSESFFKRLKELYDGEEIKENTQSQVENPNVTTDIKISLYKYLKLVFDRWLCGREEDAMNEWSFNKLYEKFVIIDSFYFKVGKNIYFNMTSLFKRMQYSLEQNTYSVASFINDVLSDNDMMFLSIQNFADLSDENLMKEMFTPIPYHKIGEVKPKTNFICLYTYKTSNHLNIEESDFTDDGFMLNDPNNLNVNTPFLLSKTVPDNGYDIPSFGVSYGKQYQSYFTSVQPDMESPIMTEQSLKAQYLLQQEASDSAKKVSFYGQDLYTVYSNNSYTCTVEMLGCAWIQPLMYFVLLNIPMFKGSYLIQKVSHHIEQGRMMTRFVGTRMCHTCTPFVTDWSHIQDNRNNGSDINDNVTSTDRNLSETVSNSCSYEQYEPSVCKDEYLTNSNINRGIAFYTDTTLGDVGVTEHSDWTLQEAITHVVRNEAGNEGTLGKQLVTTVILNRSVNTNWKNIFNKSQFNGWACQDRHGTDDVDVNEILEKGPKILIGKKAEPSRPIQIVSQSVEKGMAEEVELTEDNLSKIYMFNNLSSYSSASKNPKKGGNVIKTTKYAFTHKNHVFHYGPQKESDTSFWKKTNDTVLNDLEKELSANSLSFGVYCAIKKSSKDSESIKADIKLVDKITNNGNTFVISSNANSSMNKVYDMILDTYSTYVSELCWVMSSSDNFTALNPQKIQVTCGEGNTNRKVYMGYYDGGKITSGRGKINSSSLDGVNINFLSSVSKHYKDAPSFGRECINFDKSEAQKILDILHNEDKYGFNCSDGNVSPYYGNRETTEINVEGTTLPLKINPPLGYCEGLNYSGYFGEVRPKNPFHQGIDIGTRGATPDMLAIWDGTIVYFQSDGYGAPWFIIRHPLMIGNKYMYTRYLHGYGENIYVDRNVLKGESLGKVGGVSGYAPHLHFEMSFFEGDYSWNKFKSNLVDPAKYYYFGRYGDNISSIYNTSFCYRV